MEQNNNINWFHMLNQQLNIEQVQKILQDKQLSNDLDFKEYQNQNQSYLISRKQGFSLNFKDNKLFAVYLYGKLNKLFQQYKGQLPYNLSFDLLNSDIVSYLGEPNQKSGSGVIQITIIYNILGLEIQFVTKSWEDYSSPIDFICLFKPIKEQEHLICGLCRKISDQKCSRCKLVYYCSRQCQNTHWKVHKNFCKEIVN